MFDTIHQSPRKEYVPYEKSVTVHEHRAPTDESIKIFNELQDKAIKSVIDKFPVADNKVNGVVVTIDKNPALGFVTVCYRFSINSNVVDGRFDVAKEDYSQMMVTYKDKTMTLPEVYNHLVREISKIMIKQLWGVDEKLNIDRML